MKRIFLMVAVIVMITSCKDDPAPLPPYIARTVLISSVEVTDWPKVMGDGSGWDFTSAPDVYLAILDGNTVFYQSAVSENSTQSTFKFIVAQTISDFTKEYDVALVDSDSPDDDDLMDFYSFTVKNYVPSNSNPQLTDYPTVINLNTRSGFTVKLNLIWGK